MIVPEPEPVVVPEPVPDYDGEAEMLALLEEARIKVYEDLMRESV